MVRTTPYNCRVLGEVEGSDNANGYDGATYESMRKSAYNDLKNEAVEVVGFLNAGVNKIIKHGVSSMTGG